MKKIAILLAAVMLLTMMMVPALAADNDVDSPEKEGPTLTATVANAAISTTPVGTDKDGNTIVLDTGDVVLTTANNVSNLSEEKQEKLDTAVAAIENRDEVVMEKLSQAIANLGVTDISVNDLECVTYFDISVTGNAKTVLEEDGSLTFTVTVEGVEENDIVIVLHMLDSGDWEYLPAIVGSDGAVSFTVTSLSPFAIFVQKADAAVAAATTAADAPTSPQTGSDSAPIAVIVVAVLACFATAGVVKKFA